jgi:hypothetical protein
MKTILISTLLILGLLSIQSCDGRLDEKEISPKDKTSALLLNAPWQIKTVVADGADQTSLFNTMTLSFSSASYTTTNGGALWPSNGEWAFADESAATILRSDGVVITIDEISANSLTLSLFSAKASLGGRGYSISGNYVFTFQK